MTSSIAVSQETRKRLKSLKTGGQTYYDVIRALVASHPTFLTWAEIRKRIRDSGPEGPFEDLIAKSRKHPF